MRWKIYGLMTVVAALAGLQSVQANSGQQQYQFPPVNTNVYSSQVPVPYYGQQRPAGTAYAVPYRYMQQAPVNYRTGRWYYPQQYPVQTMARPYSYPLTQQGGYPPQMTRQMPQQMAQQAAPAPQYRSPYNPNMAATPGPKAPPPPVPKKEVKPWGDTRYIWPDFYTDFTGDFWDKMINAPYEMGYMPGGWRFPSISTPDPVTVGDAVANQVPPILDESANFINFAN